MPAPAHYLADEAKREAIVEARRLIAPLQKRIERLEKIIELICPDKSDDV